MKKILSLTLVLAMVMSMGITTAFAAGNWEGGTQVTYTAATNEEYTVTVPATLAPGGSGDVVASGTWGSNRKLTVTADDDVTLTNSINAADQKVLDVTFAGIELTGSNTESVSDTKQVAVANITDAIFGTWSGTFNYNVAMSDVAGGSTTEPSDPDDGGTTVEPGEGQISFTIDGVSYLADEGMTFDEWVESEYNTDGFEFKAIYRPAQGATGEMNMTALLDADNKNAVGWIFNESMFVIKSGHIVNENHGTLELISLTDLNYLLKVPVE